MFNNKRSLISNVAGICTLILAWPF